MPGSAQLTIKSDVGSQQFTLPTGSYVIGSEDSSDLVVPSPGIRPQHARLTITQDHFETEEIDVEDSSQRHSYPQDTELGPLRLTLSWTTTTMAQDDSREYITVRELARGGMGQVFDARDRKLDRNVAMKVLLKSDASEAERLRFYQEARVLGQLAHPNIVPVHDLGSDEEGQPFYTMKLVQGATLQEILERLKQGDPGMLAKYPLNNLLTVFQKICDAVAFAHSRGIIHRDLKPHNIMVGEFGEVLVMDWGLAKILSSGPIAEAASELPRNTKSGPTGTMVMDDATLAPGIGQNDSPAPLKFRESEAEILPSSGTQLTMEGAVMGTPHYMSPEQAEGRIADLDVRSDIFSLGGILFAILTLRPPVDGQTLEEILNKVRDANISAPTEYNAPRGSVLIKPRTVDKEVEAAQFLPLHHCPEKTIPVALSAVAMKALARKTDQRYQKVSELAADIAAFQGGFATSAEEASTLTQIRLLIRRHKTLATAASLMVLLSLGFMVKVLDSERKATKNAAIATANEQTALENEKRAEENARTAATNALIARAEADRATAAEQVALNEKEATRKALAKAQIALTEAAYHESDSLAMRAALRQVPEDLQDADYHYLAVRADTSLATLRTAINGYIMGSAPHPTRPGIFAVVGVDHRITILNARTGRHLFAFPTGWKNIRVDYALAFSPDGSLLAVGNRSRANIAVFAVRNGRKLGEWRSPTPETLEFTSKNNRLLVFPKINTSLDRAAERGRSTVLVIDPLTGKVIWSRTFDSRRLRGTYDRSGERLVIASGFGKPITLLAAEDGRELGTVTGMPDYILALDVTPDGQFGLFGNEQGRVRKVRLANGEVMYDLRVSESRVRSITITPDGRRFATLAAQQDQSASRVQLWDTATGAPLDVLLGVEGPTYEICLHPLSLELAVTGTETSKSWDLSQHPPTWKFPAGVAHPWGGFWGDDEWMVYVADGDYPTLRHLPSDDNAGDVWTNRFVAQRFDLSQNGKRAIAGSRLGQHVLLERHGDTIKELGVWDAPSSARFASLDPEGNRVWIGSAILDATNGRKLVPINMGAGAVYTGDWVGSDHIVFDGRQDVRNWVRLVDANTGRILNGAATGHGRILDITSAPDGKTFAEVGHDKFVRIRDRDSLALVKEFRAHDAPIYAVEYHPTQPILATASADLSIRLWDLSNGALLEELRGPLAVPRSLAFSPSGKRLACVSLDRFVRVWEPQCLQPATLPKASSTSNSPADNAEWRDLLADLNPDEVKARGHGWKLVDGLLHSPERSNATLALPGILINTSYHLQVTLQRLESRDFIGLILPVGTRQTAFVIDGYPTTGHVSALHLLDGNTGLYDPNRVEGRQIKDNEVHQLDIMVQTKGLISSIDVILDSKPLYHWNGPTSSLSMSPRITGMPPGRAGFASHHAEWIIKSVKLLRQ